ncbi:RNA-directed DNA polymerase, eukaryota [Tanacetum coccineum]
MESLHLSFLRVVDEGLFKGILLPGSISSSHLFYADDAMFIREWSNGNLRSILNILKCFFLASGLQINIHKSQGLGVGVPRHVVDQATSSIGCSIMQNQFRHKAWADIVLKLRSHLSKWKVKTLSIWFPLVSCYPSFDRFFDWSHCKKRVGNGNDTRFWRDRWIGDKPLSVKFPRLFALELNKYVSVAVKMDTSVYHSFRRSVRDGLEQQLMVDLYMLLEAVSLSNSQDRWICDLTGDGEFRVKEVRNYIDDMLLPSHSEPTRWVKYIPIKINIFAWRARRDCLPSRVNLIRRGVNLESPNCPLCSSYEEDVPHVLFRCDLAQLVLRRICRWWDLDWQFWTSFLEWQSWFSSIRLSSKVKNMLEGVFCVAWWSIWMFRNRTIFDENPPSRSAIFDNIVSCSFNWCHSRCNRMFSWEDWLKIPI